MMSQANEHRGQDQVVVTGYGAICAAGSNADEIWQSVLRAQSPARWWRDGGDDRPATPACVVPQINPPKLSALRGMHRMDRSVLLALEASSQAMAHAGLSREQKPESMGIIVGTSRGPVHKIAESIELARRGRFVPPRLAAHATIGSLSGTLAVHWGTTGPCLTISATCASAAYAISLAAQQIVLGTADVMLAGGSESPLERGLVQQFIDAGILGSHTDPARACRPFDRSRNGTVLGEGAAFLVLESLASANNRGAPILARLAGWAFNTDPIHETAPSPAADGLTRAMKQALRIADLQPDEIDYLNLHGTGTVLNDQCEGRAVHHLFRNCPGIRFSSTKAVTGHCFGAAAALEAVICLMAMRNQLTPPTANCEEPDGDCMVAVTPTRVCSEPVRSAMTTSLGFWGNNGVLVFTETA